MKRFCRLVILAVIAVLLIATPALAMYYAYIYIEESDGNSYTSLPLMVSANVSQLVAGKYITSTGLDTRVLTGDGYSLPHMLTNDKVLFVSDLEAYEDKTLIFYTGASALSGFPVIVGQGGNITTDDDASMEPGWVKEFLISGFFDTSAGSDKNIAYKEDAYRAWISGEDTLRVAALETGGGEQWALSHSPFNAGTHAVYVVADGLRAHLYIDDFVTAKDTVNLYDTNDVFFSASHEGAHHTFMRKTFYANGRYWAFYSHSSEIYYRTSTDGASWTAEVAMGMDGGTSCTGFGVWYSDSQDLFHVAYGNEGAVGDNNGLRYRAATPNADGSISWATGWQNIDVDNGDLAWGVVATDSDGYPWIRYSRQTGTYTYSYEITKSTSNNGTWITAGGYPTTGIVRQRGALIGFPNSNKMYTLDYRTSGDTPWGLLGRYYNGASWAGGYEVITGTATGIMENFSCIADGNDNLVITWWETDIGVLARVRYADGSFSSIITVDDTSGISGARSPSVSYDPVQDMFYIFYNKDGSIYVSGLSLAKNTLTSGYWLCTPAALLPLTATPYSAYLGVLYTGSSSTTGHACLNIPHVWNDNANDWYWMQNNVMPYANYLMWGVDGELVMHYQPNTIVQSATLPDRSTGGNDNPGTINWGSNPDGVDVSISGLLTDETEDQYDYAPYIDMGGQDIIKSGPAALTGDIDMAKLERNPFRPLALAIAEIGDFSERLAWLGMGWLALIIAMLIVHLGIESRPGERPQPGEQPQHFILTALTGLGLSIIFYITGVFPLWPVIVLSFGFIASIVYERMPVL